MSRWAEVYDGRIGCVHCWHYTGEYHPAGTPIEADICCQCGGISKRSDEPRPHGPYVKPYEGKFWWRTKADARKAEAAAAEEKDGMEKIRAWVAEEAK